MKTQRFYTISQSKKIFDIELKINKIRGMRGVIKCDETLSEAQREFKINIVDKLEKFMFNELRIIELNGELR